MILTLDDVKQYLKIDYDDDDVILLSLMNASEEYLYNATGKRFDNSNEMAKLYCTVLVHEWFKDRGLMVTANGKTVSEKIRYTLESIVLQLQYSEEV